MNTIKNLWALLPVDVRLHLVSALRIFASTFLGLIVINLQGVISGDASFSQAAFIASIVTAMTAAGKLAFDSIFGIQSTVGSIFVKK